MLTAPESPPRSWSRLTITGVYTADSSICIGMDRRTFDQLRSQATTAAPPIPAATIRGALRTTIGAIARSWTPQLILPQVAVNVTGTNGKPQRIMRQVAIACDPTYKRADDPNAQGCLTEAIVTRWKADPLWESGLWQSVQTCTCSICGLFGAPWLAGRVMVSDLIPIGLGGATYLADSHHKKGRLIWPIGAQFRFWLSVEAADYIAQGLVLLGIYALMQGQIILGADRVRGSGRGHLSIDWQGSRCWEANHLLDGLRNGLNRVDQPLTELDAQRRFIALERWLSSMARNEDTGSINA